jgi:hypothetical protein
MREDCQRTQRTTVQSQPVKQSLDRLRELLDSGAPLDDALRDELAALDADIRRALGEPTPQGGAGLMQRARDLSLRFAEQHPTAAAVLRELGVLLEGIGA